MAYLQVNNVMEYKSIPEEIEFEKMYINNIWANIIRLLNSILRIV